MLPLQFWSVGHKRKFYRHLEVKKLVFNKFLDFARDKSVRRSERLSFVNKNFLQFKSKIL